jgi:hypothetical protein
MLDSSITYANTRQDKDGLNAKIAESQSAAEKATKDHSDLKVQLEEIQASLAAAESGKSEADAKNFD